MNVVSLDMANYHCHLAMGQEFPMKKVFPIHILSILLGELVGGGSL
jgi:hypothetical protein